MKASHSRILRATVVAISVLTISFTSYAQCVSIALFSQSDVDEFPIDDGCTTIEDQLIISADDITNPDGLAAVSRVGQDINRRRFDCRRNPLLQYAAQFHSSHFCSS